jgi:hypothetical protein
MKAKDLYREILRVCKSSAPKNQEQEYRFWLAYHGKNLISLSKEKESTQMIEKGLQDLEFIKRTWKLVEEKGIQPKNPRYKFPISGYHGWLPGIATRKWIEGLSKR